MQNCTPNPQIFPHVSFLLFVPPQFFVFSELWSLWSMVPACLCFKLGVVVVSDSSSQQLSLFCYFFFLFFFLIWMSKSASGICERDVDIRFVIFLVFLWNRYRNPLHEFVKGMSTSVSLFFLIFLWNGCRNPLQDFCETDFDIRFDIFFLK